MDIRIEKTGKVSRIAKTTPYKPRDIKLREWYYQRGLAEGKGKEELQAKDGLPRDIPSQYRSFYIQGFNKK